MDFLWNWNKEIFLLINHWQGEIFFLDILMYFFTLTGGFPLLVIIFILLYFFDRKRMRNVFFTVILAGMAGTLVVYLLKWLISAPRPFVVFPEANVIGPLIRTPSFPSAHTQFAFSSATVLAKAYRGSWRFLYPWAGVVGFSRIYIGVHFLFDVIAGGLIGYLSGKLILMVKNKKCGKE